jgi:murein DD-endopeptidase MepM/ murein hydrolase activator NlpD
MKNLYSIRIILLLLLFSTLAEAQHIVYHRNSTLYISDKNNTTGARNLGQHVSVLKSELAPVTNRVYTIQHIDPALTVEEDTRFYQGIQSPYDPGLWLFVIDDYVGKNYSCLLYDAKTNERRVLFTNGAGAPNTLQMFVPFEWTGDKEVIFLEAISDRGHRHEGIYTYNIRTGESRPVGVPDHYTTTPVLSPDKTTLLYAASLERDPKRDLVHGISERIMTYELPSKKERVVTEARGVSHAVLGWASKTITEKNIVDQETYNQKQNEEIEGPSAARVAAVSYKLPWPSGITYCTTRDGNSESPGSPGSSSTCANLGSHTYVAFDFDTPNNADDPVLAVAAGKVIQVTHLTDSYGKHVRVKHDDGSVSLYAHMKSISVSVNDCVVQGTKLGIEGTTGNSTGDHIHFEREVGGSNTFPTFSDCGCTPHVGYNYRSTNTRLDNYSCTPACPASHNFTATISSGTYKASGTITASAALAANAITIFNASTSVVLKTGFSARYANGNTFTAKLGGCAAFTSSTADFGLEDATVINDPAVREAGETNFTLYPNPAVNEVMVKYILTSSSSIVITIYDMSGRLEKRLTYGAQEPGTHQLNIPLNDVKAGLYFLKVKAGNQEFTKKLRVTK